MEVLGPAQTRVQLLYMRLRCEPYAVQKVHERSSSSQRIQVDARNVWQTCRMEDTRTKPGRQIAPLDTCKKQDREYSMR